MNSKTILKIQILPLLLQAVFSTKTLSVHRFICKQSWDTSSRHSRQDFPSPWKVINTCWSSSDTTSNHQMMAIFLLSIYTQQAEKSTDRNSNHCIRLQSEMCLLNIVYNFSEHVNPTCLAVTMKLMAVTISKLINNQHYFPEINSMGRHKTSHSRINTICHFRKLSSLPHL